MIFDHDYKNREAFLLGKHISDEIIIENNRWISTDTVIKGKYDNGFLIVQKREERVTVL